MSDPASPVAARGLYTNCPNQNHGTRMKADYTD